MSSCQENREVKRLAFVGLILAVLVPRMAVCEDSRSLRNGLTIPSEEGYADQPYIVVTRDGDWLYCSKYSILVNLSLDAQ